MKKQFYLVVLAIFLFSCKTHVESRKSQNKDCYDTKNFIKVKEYVINRINTSGMGKLYIEYPEDKTQLNDGIMRPSKHPENLYDTYIDETSGDIILKGSNMKFTYNSTKGLLNKDNTPEKDLLLANEIFCYLLGIN